MKTQLTPQEYTAFKDTPLKKLPFQRSPGSRRTRITLRLLDSGIEKGRAQQIYSKMIMAGLAAAREYVLRLAREVAEARNKAAAEGKIGPVAEDAYFSGLPYHY